METHDLEFLAHRTFSNVLITDEIWTHLHLQDLLHLSLVNKTWFKSTRNYIRRFRLCPIRLTDNACIALKAVNDFMKTITTDCLFNGIHHEDMKYIPEDERNKPYEMCRENCVRFLCKDNISSAHNLYANILTKMTFKFVKFCPSYHPDCPFMQFAKIMLLEKHNEIKELDLGGLSCYDYIEDTYDNRINWTGKMFEKENIQLQAFPNLVKVKANYFGMVFQNTPKMKAIHSIVWSDQYCPSYVPKYTWEEKYLLRKQYQHAIVNTELNSLSALIYLAADVKPKLKRMKINALSESEGRRGTVELFHDQVSLFQFQTSMAALSETICYSLKELECSVYALWLIVNACGPKQFVNVHHIKTHLFSYGGCGGQRPPITWAKLLKSTNIGQHFPNTQSFTFSGRNSNSGYDFGLTVAKAIGRLYGQNYRNALKNVCASGASKLTLTKDYLNDTKYFTCIFSNVKCLHVKGYESKKFVVQILKEGGNNVFSKIEQLSFNTRPLQLDDIFGLNVRQAGTGTTGRSSPYKEYSVFNRKRLIKIQVHPLEDCLHCWKKSTEDLVVSKETAALICAKRPGFIIQLIFNASPRCSSGTTSITSLDKLFQHLKPFVDICHEACWFGEPVGYVKHMWTIKFKKME